MEGANLQRWSCYIVGSRAISKRRPSALIHISVCWVAAISEDTGGTAVIAYVVVLKVACSRSDGPDRH